MRHRKSLLVALVLTLTAFAGLVSAGPAPAKVPDAAQTGRKAELTTKMDTAFAKAMKAAGRPGVQAVLMRDGRVLWSSSGGKAVVDPAVPVSDRTLFSFASFSKFMLAAFALHQVEAGVLGLDTPLARYVGNDVPGSRVVTVRMLLNHTAGYPDLYESKEVEPLLPGGKRYDPDRPFTFRMLSAGIHAPVAPGKNWAYSNTGYIILAHVLSRTAGGDDALACAYRRFIQPAAAAAPMTEDLVTMRRSERALRSIAHGTIKEDDGSLTDYFTESGARGIPTDVYGMPFGDGLFAGTALGAAQFVDGLYARNRLLSPATVRQMTTPTPQANSQEREDDRSYGMGTYRFKAAGRTWQGHSGNYGGYTSLGGTDLTRGVTLMVATNREAPGADPAGSIFTALAEAYATSAG